MPGRGVCWCQVFPTVVCCPLVSCASAWEWTGAGAHQDWSAHCFPTIPETLKYSWKFYFHNYGKMAVNRSHVEVGKVLLAGNGFSNRMKMWGWLSLMWPTNLRSQRHQERKCVPDFLQGHLYPWSRIQWSHPWCLQAYERMLHWTTSIFCKLYKSCDTSRRWLERGGFV